MANRNVEYRIKFYSGLFVGKISTLKNTTEEFLKFPIDHTDYLCMGFSRESTIWQEYYNYEETKGVK